MAFPLEFLTIPEKLKKVNGIYRLMDHDFATVLDGFLEKFNLIREKEGVHITDPSVLKNLPHSLAAKKQDWKWRACSLQLLMKTVMPGKHIQNILEIGAWNGWLSQHLTQPTNRIIAVDNFTHKHDGLRAIPINAKRIFPVQMDSRATSKLFRTNSFDLIVLNHCLSFFENPTDYFSSLIPLLKDNGIIISVGTTIYKDTSKKEKELKTMAEAFYEQNGFDLFFVPVKGFLDSKDKEYFKKAGCRIIPYRRMWLKNLVSFLTPSKPYYCAIFYQKMEQN